MKTKTIKGTSVEIVGTCGCNLVLAKVGVCKSLAQVNAEDLIMPSIISEELAELKFHKEKK